MNLDMPIEQLDLSVRALNCLKREGVHTLGELLDRSEAELIAIRNFGEKSVVEIREKLRELGMRPEGEAETETETEPGLGGPVDGDSGDREPRRPGPTAGAGAAALRLPESEHDEPEAV